MYSMCICVYTHTHSIGSESEDGGEAMMTFLFSTTVHIFIHHQAYRHCCTPGHIKISSSRLPTSKLDWSQFSKVTAAATHPYTHTGILQPTTNTEGGTKPMKFPLPLATFRLPAFFNYFFFLSLSFSFFFNIKEHLRI